jgi:hypothetical protein
VGRCASPVADTYHQDRRAGVRPRPAAPVATRGAWHARRIGDTAGGVAAAVVGARGARLATIHAPAAGQSPRQVDRSTAGAGEVARSWRAAHRRVALGDPAGRMHRQAGQPMPAHAQRGAGSRQAIPVAALPAALCGEPCRTKCTLGMGVRSARRASFGRTSGTGVRPRSASPGRHRCLPPTRRRARRLTCDDRWEVMPGHVYSGRGCPRAGVAPVPQEVWDARAAGIGIAWEGPSSVP